MLVNDFRRIGRAIAARKVAIEKLSKKAKRGAGLLNLSVERPRRYGIEFSFTPGDLQPQERSFVVNGGTKFLCRTLESSFRAIGTSGVDDGAGGTVAGQRVQVTMPFSAAFASGGGIGSRGYARNRYFDYEFQIRDTGSDREWQNVRTPSNIMMSGMIAPCRLPVRAHIKGGSEVFVRVDPFLSESSFVGLSSFFSVSAYVVHISFSGTEVGK